AGIMGAARYPVALARDGLMPKRFAAVMGKNNIPVPALLLTGGLMVGVQFLNLELLVQVASTVVILSYILTNSSVLILRESGVLNYRPSFRTPLYPIVPLVCILLFSLLVLRMGSTSIHLALLIVLGSVVLYYCYGRNVRKDSAFTHLLGRLTQNEIVTSELEKELRDVVRSRDEIVTDVFDETVEKAPAMVLKRCRSVRELFGVAADVFSQYTQISARELHELLIKRERMASTVIAPGVAVPHITLPSEKNLFAMLLIKVENGVNFSKESMPVDTVVFLICSPDEKTRHSHSLAMIAQAILDPDFNKRWKKAYSSQQIKDIFLLAKRIRSHK
ncbi:MAG: amino acid permease, partial [Kiritimatiellae bacterium]|nr:amino acid permease [Kiritimatiellia bacterium]